MLKEYPVIKYPYSKGQIYFAAIFITAMFLFFIYFFIIDVSDPGIWVIGLFILAEGVLGRYFFKKYFSPFLKNETALELDEEKLQYFIKNKVLYWKNVDYINSRYGGRGGGLEISFAIKQGSRNVTISTRYIAGNDEGICNTISEYFEKYKQVDF